MPSHLRLPSTRCLGGAFLLTRETRAKEAEEEGQARMTDRATLRGSKPDQFLDTAISRSSLAEKKARLRAYFTRGDLFLSTCCFLHPHCSPREAGARHGQGHFTQVCKHCEATSWHAAPHPLAYASRVYARMMDEDPSRRLRPFHHHVENVVLSGEICRRIDSYTGVE